MFLTCLELHSPPVTRPADNSKILPLACLLAAGHRACVSVSVCVSVCVTVRVSVRVSVYDYKYLFDFSIPKFPSYQFVNFDALFKL